MKTTLMLSVLVLLMVGVFGVGERVEGASAVSTTGWQGGGYNYLAHYADGAGQPGCFGCTNGWFPALHNNLMVTVTYVANVTNLDTGTVLSSGAIIPTGTHLYVGSKPFANTDISWFATGETADSPYGHWISGAGPSSAPSVCDPADYLSTQDIGAYFGLPAGIMYENIYFPFSVNPPVVTYSHSGTATLSCNASGQNCTVTSPGTINFSVNYPGTYGKFYHRYYEHTGVGWDGCHGGNQVLQLMVNWFSGVGGEYVHSIPAQTIPFTFTAVSTNNPPTAPTITPQPFTGAAGTSHTFNFTGTDPDAGNTIRYQIDWNNDGFPDAWTAFGASGVTQSANNSPILWPTAGVKTFKARTEDNNFSVSAWTTANATINNPVAPTVVTNPAVGNTVHGTGNPNGGATTGWFRYSTTDPGTCNDTFGTRAPLAGGTALGAGNLPILFSQPLTTTPGTTYYYCAIASNAGGTGYGTIDSFLTTPATPTGLTATPDATCSSGIINISWNASTGATSYDIEHDGVFTNVVGTTYTHSGLANGSLHTYRIRANNAGGSSAWSASRMGTTAAACPLPDLKPLSFTANVPSTGGTFFDGETIVLNGTMENNGTLATTLDFDDNFSYRWNGMGAWTNITPYTPHLAPFAGGATGIDNATLNPSGSGNLHIQYCVDSNNSILEADELNCMEKSFIVHPKPTGTLTVTSPIPYNTKSTIGWTTNSPTACTPKVTGAGGPWSGPSGSQPSALLTSDTLYSLTCAPYPGVLDTKLVDVITDPFIKANPRIVEKGNPATINWGTGTEVNCSVLANGTVVNALVTGLGSRTDVINANTTYTIDCPVIDKSVKVEVQGYGTET